MTDWGSPVPDEPSMTRFSIYVASTPGYAHAGAFTEVAHCLSASLRDLGHAAECIEDISALGTGSADPVIVLGTNLVAHDPALRADLPASALLYNLEQIEVGSPWCSDELLALYRDHRVLDYSPQNIDRLGQLGITDVGLLEVGYHPTLTRVESGPEDIDVLFYGSLNDRRAAVLADLQARGAVVHHAFGVYGAERDALIARSSVVLNMHYFEARVFEIVRVSYLLANRRFVVSERGGDATLEAPFAAGLAFADYDELADTVESFLTNPHARATVAARGFDIMCSRPQADLLRTALGEVLV